MPNTHAIANGISCAYWDVDSLNMAGICETADLDNGALVTLKKMNVDATTGKVQGFEYVVEPAADGADNVWFVDSPEVGYSLEMQIHDDPRYFYNEQGKPMSIKGILSGVDCVEVTAPLFVGGTLPTVAQIGQYVAPAAGGKYAAPVAQAPAAGAYFRVEALNTITCGADEVPSVILRCMANHL